MSITISTIPTPLTATAEAELEMSRTYIDGEDAQDLIDSAQFESDELHTAVSELFESPFINALDMLDRIDEARGHAKAVDAYLRDLREGLVDRLGIPAALKEAATSLHDLQSAHHVAALRNGLSMMQGSDRKMSSELREALVKLGMPKEYRGMAVNTFRRAMLGDWLKLPQSSTPTANGEAA